MSDPFLCKDCGGWVDHLPETRDCPVYREKLKPENQPYLVRIVEEFVYNPKYGDDRICKCGHPYHRHFDSWDHMHNIGCKYCDCYEFEEK